MGSRRSLCQRPKGQAVKRMRLRRSRGGKKTKKNADSRLALENTVVDLSTHQLTEQQRNLLAKGLSFCPTEPYFNTIELSADLHAFYLRLRLRDYFADKPSATNDKDALQHTRLHRKSNWQPPKGSTSPEVEFFVRFFHQSLRSSVQNEQPRLTNNLTKDESQALQELQGCKAIVIRPADKGSAVVIQNHSDYRKEVMRQLEDAKFYKHLAKDPTASNNATIREAVKTLRNQGVINDKTAADLVETKAKCPHFYTLPKIHKNAEAPPGRPIVSSIRAPTERISAFVDIVLKPLVKSLPSYIKDTKDFLAKLKSLPGPLLPNGLLFTRDVVGLYNNIPHRDGLKACQLALDQRDSCDPPTTSIVNLAKLVLELNAFQFEEKFFCKLTALPCAHAWLPVMLTFLWVFWKSPCWQQHLAD